MEIDHIIGAQCNSFSIPHYSLDIHLVHTVTYQTSGNRAVWDTGIYPTYHIGPIHHLTGNFYALSNQCIMNLWKYLYFKATFSKIPFPSNLLHFKCGKLGWNCRSVVLFYEKGAWFGQLLQIQNILGVKLIIIMESFHILLFSF